MSMVDPLFEMVKRGLDLQKSGHKAAAQALYRQVLAQNPSHALALHLSGVLAGQMGQLQQAVELLQRSVEINPGDPLAWNNFANALQDFGATQDALHAVSRALAMRPEYVTAWITRATILQALSRHEEAVEAFRAALNLAPDRGAAWTGLWRASMESCQWSDLPDIIPRVQAAVAQDRPALLPFEALSFSEDEALHLKCAAAYAHDIVIREEISPFHHPPRPRNSRIKVAYLSSDFHEHATSHLAVGMFEAHDRSRFETFGVSFGPDDGSPMRDRVSKSFEHFLDVRDWTSASIANHLRSLQIDIAVDLKGFTRNAMASALLRRPAPIVVNYLGYPGSLGVSAFDYVIGDAIVTPFSSQQNYAEKIVHMPACYQANDNRRGIAADAPSRKDEGLPPSGFVFAAFNNCYKITPTFFAVWMKLLREVKGSVLWLICESKTIQQRLRSEAVSRGVAAERLVFAQRRSLEMHLARHVHAGLLLDTLPYNAHTTASDALWAGVPVVTLQGQSFAGRVAASLLHATHLPELIAHSLDEYFTLAKALADDPQRLTQLKTQLSTHRMHLPLFDTPAFTAAIERAFTTMHDRWQAGLPPEQFSVPALPTPHH